MSDSTSTHDDPEPPGRPGCERLRRSFSVPSRGQAVVGDPGGRARLRRA